MVQDVVRTAVSAAGRGHGPRYLCPRPGALVHCESLCRRVCDLPGLRLIQNLPPLSHPFPELSPLVSQHPLRQDRRSRPQLRHWHFPDETRRFPACRPDLPGDTVCSVRNPCPGNKTECHPGRTPGPHQNGVVSAGALRSLPRTPCSPVRPVAADSRVPRSSR